MLLRLYQCSTKVISQQNSWPCKQVPHEEKEQHVQDDLNPGFLTIFLVTGLTMHTRLPVNMLEKEDDDK